MIRRILLLTEVSVVIPSPKTFGETVILVASPFHVSVLSAMIPLVLRNNKTGFRRVDCPKLKMEF